MNGDGEKVRVWFCGPDVGFAQMMASTLGVGFEVRVSAGFEPGAWQEESGWCGVGLLDLREAGALGLLEAGLKLIDGLRGEDPSPPLVVMISGEDHDLMRQVLDKGAYDTIACPPDMVELRLLLQRAHQSHEAARQLRQLQSRQLAEPMGEMVGATESMQQVFSLARKIAPCDVTALITGETGTGKELLARAVHRLSGRAHKPFVAINCAAIPDTLLESELFGYEKGAFTGAAKRTLGKLESADGGTVFLDEIGEMPASLQVKLLRVV